MIVNRAKFVTDDYPVFTVQLRRDEVYKLLDAIHSVVESSHFRKDEWFHLKPDLAVLRKWGNALEEFVDRCGQ